MISTGGVSFCLIGLSTEISIAGCAIGSCTALVRESYAHGKFEGAIARRISKQKQLVFEIP